MISPAKLACCLRRNLTQQTPIMVIGRSGDMISAVFDLDGFSEAVHMDGRYVVPFQNEQQLKFL